MKQSLLQAKFKSIGSNIDSATETKAAERKAQRKVDNFGEDQSI